MGFSGRPVWSLALAIGTSPLCYVIHRRLSESLGSSSGKGWCKPKIRDYWLDHERDINVIEARALYNALSFLFLQSEMHKSTSGRTMLLSRRLGKMAVVGIHLLIER